MSMSVSGTHVLARRWSVSFNFSFSARSLRSPHSIFFLKDGKDLGKLGTDYMWQVNEFAAKHGLLSK